MVFKYPPWIVPFFFPFALLPLDWAKWIWGVLEVLSLASVIFWLSSRMRTPILALVTILFWGLWAGHALDGQVILLVLAAALWGWRSKETLLCLALSTKVFSLFPLVSFKWDRKRKKTLLQVSALALALSLPALWTTPGKNPVTLTQSWFQAASSGPSLLEGKDIRGRQNPSLTQLTLRALRVDSRNTAADLIAFLVLGALAAIAWFRFSKPLTQDESWLGWLALTPVIHPLPWWHLFVFSFPLAAISVDRCFGQKGRKWLWLALVGTLLISIATESVLGPLGVFLESIAAKSWGTLACAMALVLSRSRLRALR
jgi:hypothetical protein